MEQTNTPSQKLRLGRKTTYPRLPKEAATYQDPKEISPTELPTARISQDDSTSFARIIQEMAAEFSTVSSKFPIEFLDVMQNLSMVNPDVSQMIDNIVELGNTGHKVVIDGVTKSQQEAMLEEINSFQQNAFSRFGGIEGFINSLLAQIGRGGAGSVEWVIQDNLDGIEKVVFVPLKTVRFTYDQESGEYRAQQKINDIAAGKMGLIQLNPYTYQYCPLQLLDNSPYAIPPILAALESIMIQRDIIKNFKFVAKKMGLLGFVTFLLKAPQRMGAESDSAYLARCKTYLQDQAAVIKHNYRDGMAIGFQENFKVESTSLMGNAQGASEIMKVVEEQVFSGLKADPALHGRTYSTTETYAGVVYEKMLSQLSNYHRLVKQILEYGYRLHLILNGFNYKQLYVEFEPSKSLTSERDESTYNLKLQNLQTLYDQGIINQNQFAQEAGYDSPDMEEPRVGRGFDIPADGADDSENPTEDSKDDVDEEKSEESQTVKLFWYKAEGFYRLAKKTKSKKKPWATVTANLSNGISSKLLDDEADERFEELWPILLAEYYPDCSCCTQGSESLVTTTQSQRQLKQYMNSYFRAVFPSIKGGRNSGVREAMKLIQNMDFSTMDSELFADSVFEKLASGFENGIVNSPLQDQVRKKISQAYKFFRILDNSPFEGEFPVKPSFNQVDNRAIKFMRDSDDFYFGRYVTDPRTKRSLKGWLTDEYLKSGRSLRDPGEMDIFRKKFGNRVAKEDYKVLRVVETSVSRAKNWGNVLTAEQAKVQTIEITGPKGDNLICPWCQEMVGKVFKLKPVIAQIKDTMSRAPEDLPLLNPFLPGRLTPAQVKGSSPDQLLAQGIALAPYHPHCRHRTVVRDFE